MASIIDSFRETFGDNLSFLKIVVLAIPVYFCYQLYITSKTDFSGFYFLFDITVFLLFGFLIKVTNGVLNERDSVFPSLNPLPWALSAIKGSLAILPYVLISCFLANYISSITNVVFWFDVTIKSIVWLVAASIILTSFLMYTTRERISDVYNFKTFSEKAGDSILMIIFFVIQLIVINIPTTAFIGYVLLVLFGFGGLFNFYLAMVIIFNLTVAGHYFAQLHYELLGQTDKY